MPCVLGRNLPHKVSNQDSAIRMESKLREWLCLRRSLGVEERLGTGVDLRRCWARQVGSELGTVGGTG